MRRSRFESFISGILEDLLNKISGKHRSRVATENALWLSVECLLHLIISRESYAQLKIFS